MLKAAIAKDILALKYPHTLIAKQIRCRAGFYTPPTNFCRHGLKPCPNEYHRRINSALIELIINQMLNLSRDKILNLKNLSVQLSANLNLVSVSNPK